MAWRHASCFLRLPPSPHLPYICVSRDDVILLALQGKLDGAAGGGRTHTVIHQRSLSPPRLPFRHCGTGAGAFCTCRIIYHRFCAAQTGVRSVWQIAAHLGLLHAEATDLHRVAVRVEFEPVPLEILDEIRLPGIRVLLAERL